MTESLPHVRQVHDGEALTATFAPPAVEHPADRVTLPEPMLGYACNQQGCCCGGWQIGFRPHDLVRLGRALPPADRQRLLTDVEVVEEAGPDGSPVVREVHIVRSDGSCRLLADDGKRCEVHAAAGVEALPDICVDFPVVSYDAGGRAELFFDPVCPSVLQALVSETPIREKVLYAPFADRSLERRSAHRRPFPAIRFGVAQLGPDLFAAIRNRVVAALADSDRPLLAQLHAIDAAWAEVGLGLRRPEEFTLGVDRDPEPYAAFFRRCADGHSAATLGRVFQSYRRFLFTIPLDWRHWDELEKHLDRWEEASTVWWDAGRPGLSELQRRYAAHRHFSPFLTIQGRLHFAVGAVVHMLATATRYAAAFGAVLRRPVDGEILLAALGTSEYVYRSLEIAPESLPWFGFSM